MSGFKKGFPAVAAGVVSGALLCGGSVMGGEVVLNDPDRPLFHANALDQPRLYGLLTRDGEVIEADGAPVLFRAFVDTGASGFVISNLHAGENEEVASFGFAEEDYIGKFTNLGLGGPERGNVTRELGVRVLNDPVPLDGSPEIDEFIDYGEHSLWVREAPGIGEIVEVTVDEHTIALPASPINIIGMPVIEQRVMVMEWVASPLEAMFPEEEWGDLFSGLKEVDTKLLEPGDPGIPQSNATLDLRMHDFVGEGYGEEDETLPSVTRNPVVENVAISHDPSRDSVVGDWLFDTGAGASFISFDWARTVGLIPETFDDLESFLEEHEAGGGMVSVVGGIGPDVVTVPVLSLNELRVPAREGFDLVWEDVRILVFEHEELADLGLEGIFGMNLIGPAITLDASLLGELFDGGFGQLGDDALLLFLMILADISPSPFDSIVFEVTGEETAELRLFSERVALFLDEGVVSFESWREEQFDEPELAGELTDPGGFGLPLLLRYAFGMDGNSPRHDYLPAVSYQPDEDGSSLNLEFYRRRNDTILNYQVEASEDLVEWDPVEGEWTVTPSDPDKERVSVRLPAPAPETGTMFFRVRVEKPE